MTDTSDTDAIEERLARSRTSLAATLETLQDRISVDHLARDALETVRAGAAAYTRSIDRAVRANPVALALTGVGIAWLLIGARGDDGEGDGEGQAKPGVAQERWARRVDQMRDRASRNLHQIESDAADYAQALRDGLLDEVDTARDYAAERAAVVTEFAALLRDGFADGLEDLSAEARDRISAARERAYAATLRTRRAAVRGARETSRLLEEHPMVAGLCAAALGAAVAAALPRTRAEDRAFGAERDRLLAEARRLLAEERDRARKIASGVADDLREGASATAAAVADQVSETGETIRARVQDGVDAAAPPAADAPAKGAGKDAAKDGRKDAPPRDGAKDAGRGKGSAPRAGGN